MHAYRMQRQLVARRRDRVANIAQRNSVYQTLNRLERDGLIAIHDTVREERRPERTVYEITASGTAALREWLLDGLATPTRQYPLFPAALAELALLPPSRVLRQLEGRVDALAARLTQAGHDEGSPRSLADEYARELLRAELAWVTTVIRELRSGTLSWPTA